VEVLGNIVLADALHTQDETARQILYEQGADYSLILRDNQPTLLKTAQQRGFTPRYVCFDGWYSALENLKLIRTLGWHWLTRLKQNRLVNPDGEGNRPLAECVIRAAGTRLHLKGYGFILVFRIDTPDVVCGFPQAGMAHKRATA
jgi:hypothetical protein